MQLSMNAYYGYAVYPVDGSACTLFVEVNFNLLKTKNAEVNSRLEWNWNGFFVFQNNNNFSNILVNIEKIFVT